MTTKRLNLLILIGYIFLARDAEGVPLKYRRQASTVQSEALDPPSAPSPGGRTDTNQSDGPLRQRQPFSIIGYSEDFKRGYVNPGTESLRQRLRGVDFNDSPAVAPLLNDPSSPLVQKPFIWVIPYAKSGRQGKAAKGAKLDDSDSSTQDSINQAEVSTVTSAPILNTTSDAGLNDLEGQPTDGSISGKGVN